MRKQGIKRKDSGCCPGHDKFPRETYGSRTSKKAKRRTDQLANQRARAWGKVELMKAVEEAVVIMKDVPTDSKVVVIDSLGSGIYDSPRDTIKD